VSCIGSMVLGIQTLKAYRIGQNDQRSWGSTFSEIVLKKKKAGPTNSEKYKMRNKLLESHTKWQVYSEMNTEVFARRLKRGVISDVCAMTAAF